MEICKHCGTPTNSPDAVCDNCRMRNITLNKMYEFYQCFYKSITHSQKIRDCINEYNSISNQKPKSNWLIFWVISICVGIPYTLYMLWAVVGILGDDFGTIAGIMLLVIMVIIFMIAIILIAKGEQKKERELYNLKNSRLPELDRIIEAEKQQILDLYNQTNKFIPEQYSDLMIVATLIQLIESRRADSLKEAINLYENIKHTDEMLRLQQEMNRNTRISAVANVVSAVANVETAYNTRN